MTVSVPFSADPNQVLAAFRKIQEEAKRTGRDLNRLGDINFPGLEGAKQTLVEINHGFEQMFSKAVKGQHAEALRSGNRSGMYDRDVVSWMQNVQRQFPDERAQRKHMEAVLAQSGRLAEFGGGGGAPGSPGMPPPGAGGAPGMPGLWGMTKGALGLAGVGVGMGFAAKMLGSAKSEDIAVSDLRRGSGGLDEDFNAFRENIRKASEGLGITYIESAKLGEEFKRQSGMRGSVGIGAGVQSGTSLARMFGMDPGAGVGLTGRASWLRMTGTDSPEKLANFFAKAVVQSGMFSKADEAMGAMVRYSERTSAILGKEGNLEGYLHGYAALMRFGSPGVRDNAERILGGWDDAVRQGGHAGVAGQNALWNVMHKNGVKDPFEADYRKEGGFFGPLPSGKQIGPEMIRMIREKYGSRGKYMELNAMSQFFGGSQHAAEEALSAFGKYEKKKMSGSTLKAEIERIKHEALVQSDPGFAALEAAKKLDRSIEETFSKLVPAMTEFTEVLGKTVQFLNRLFPDEVGTRDQAKDFMSTLPGVAGGLGGAYKVVPELWNAYSKSKEGTPLNLQASPLRDVLSLQSRYGVTIDSARKVGDGSYLQVTAPNQKAGEDFAYAANQLAEALRLGISVDVRVNGSKGGITEAKGGIGPPKPR